MVLDDLVLGMWKFSTIIFTNKPSTQNHLYEFSHGICRELFPGSFKNTEIHGYSDPL